MNLGKDTTFAASGKSTKGKIPCVLILSFTRTRFGLCTASLRTQVHAKSVRSLDSNQGRIINISFIIMTSSNSCLFSSMWNHIVRSGSENVEIESICQPQQ